MPRGSLTSIDKESMARSVQPRYTAFGWVDDDVNFNELVAMNPDAHESAMKLRQAANAKPKNAATNMAKSYPSIPTMMRLPRLPPVTTSSSYVAAAGDSSKKKQRSNKKK